MALLKKADKSTTAVDYLVVSRGPAGEERYPALREFLCMTAWEDGSRREVGTLLVFLDGGLLKLLLNDKDGGRVAFLSGPSVDDLLSAADLGLLRDSLDWRAARKPQGGGGRGK